MFSAMAVYSMNLDSTSEPKLNSVSVSAMENHFSSSEAPVRFSIEAFVYSKVVMTPYPLPCCSVRGRSRDGDFNLSISVTLPKDSVPLSGRFV